MTDLRTIVILGGGLLVSLCGLAYSLFCVLAPRKAILLQSRWSSAVDEDTARDPAMVLQYRIMGVILAFGTLGFVIAVTRQILRSI
jgi:hypothetical protein